MNNHSEAGKMVAKKPLKITLIITLAFMVTEVIGGILSNSLALLGDAGHMFVDALALALSFFALTIAQKPPTGSKTYGFYRVEIMAALANGVLLILISLYILYEAYRRFLSPPEVRAPLMLVVSVIGLFANIAGALLLRRNLENLNIKAAFWHIVTDTLSSVGVIAAAVFIAVTGLSVADPIIATFISGIILWGAVRLVGESVNILLEAVPKRINMSEVVSKLKSIPGVADVHDIHIWTITSGIYALSTHLAIEDRMVSRSTELITAVNDSLSHNFGIRHTTIQLECDTCPSGYTCGICPMAAELRYNKRG